MDAYVIGYFLNKLYLKIVKTLYNIYYYVHICIHNIEFVYVVMFESFHVPDEIYIIKMI